MATPPFAIRVNRLSKRFKYWSDRPTSAKTLLIDLLRGRLKLGDKREISILEDLDLEIGSGEFVGIMGRNGVGKSTLLKLISGIYQPTSGSIEVNGAIAPLIELGAGFHGDLSGHENVFLNAAILGFGRKETLSALPAILEFAELGEKIHMPVKNYSSGMLVRLGFAVATHLNAPILLVDEVLAVGDLGFQEKCLRKIEALHREGRTIVLITHEPQAIQKHCTRCVIIDERRKVFDGPTTQALERYQALFALDRS